MRRSRTQCERAKRTLSAARANIEIDFAAIGQLILNLCVPLSIHTVASHTQVIYNVCVVFSSLFAFVCNF